MQLPQSIAVRSLWFIVIATLILLGSVSWSVYRVSYEAIESNVEHKLILEGEYITKLFLRNKKERSSKERYKALLQELSAKSGGYAFLTDADGELLLASNETVRKHWQDVYAKVNTLNKAHPYKHYIRFERFILENDPVFKAKSFGVIYELEGTPGYKMAIALPYDKAFAPAKNILSQIILTIVSVVILLAIVAYLIIRRNIVTPLRNIAAQLRVGDDFEIEQMRDVVTDKQGEIGELVATLNLRTRMLKELNKEIEATQREIIFTMGAIGESRSKETANHVKRVAEYSYVLAEAYGLSPKEAKTLKEASPMHDIGKVAIADSILKKPGRLTKEEAEEMKRHTVLGYEMLKHSKRTLLQAAAIVAHEHHEKYDGSGYPRGLKADEIHIYGRITALADVFDALGSQRIYKKAWEDEKIFELFKQERGKHFDPKLVDLFFENVEKFLSIRERFRDV